MKRQLFVSVIGPNTKKCSPMLYEFGIELGQSLIDSGFGIICGGKGGIMEAVCKGAHNSLFYKFGLTIGIIPDADADEANKYCDIIIPTGIGLARNIIVVNASKVIISIGGGAGTLSELAFASQLKKTVFCFTNFEGWSKNLAGMNLDIISEKPFYQVNSIDDLLLKLNNVYNEE